MTEQEIREEWWRISNVLAANKPEAMDWNGIYALKGRAGLWYFRGGKQGSGNFGFVNIRTKQQTTVFHINREDMYQLGKSWVVLMPEFDDKNKLQKGEQIPLSDVMELMEKMVIAGKLKLDIFMKNDAQCKEIMKMVVPDYDPDEFKLYHMRRIWKWFLVLHEFVEGVRKRIDCTIEEFNAGQKKPQPSDV